MGTQITTYLLGQEKIKQYSRAKINAIATKFYTKLYHDYKSKLEKIKIVNNSQESNILKLEVVEMVKNLKKNKTVGCNVVANEQQKLEGEELLRTFTVLYNRILREQKLPKNWLCSNIILLQKKTIDQLAYRKQWLKFYQKS